MDEVDDPTVIQQKDRLSCGPACAEMLLRGCGVNDISQELIASETGTPVSVPDLARTLNQFDPSQERQWIGGCLEIPGATFAEVVEVLISTGTWMAELREPGARLGHLVLVDGYAPKERIRIRDPWDGTRYKMELEEFLQYWTLQGIYASEL
ncbi:MAG: papain-like cysteine protease family protein [Xenococcaceae cyanobacterium]